MKRWFLISTGIGLFIMMIIWLRNKLIDDVADDMILFI